MLDPVTIFTALLEWSIGTLEIVHARARGLPHDLVGRLSVEIEGSGSASTNSDVSMEDSPGEWKIKLVVASDRQVLTKFRLDGQARQLDNCNGTRTNLCDCRSFQDWFLSRSILNLSPR